MLSLGLPVPLAVFHGAHPLHPPETLGKKTQRREAQKMGDLLEVIETVNQLCDEIERENRVVRSAGIQRRTAAIRQMLSGCIDEYFS